MFSLNSISKKCNFLKKVLFTVFTGTVFTVNVWEMVMVIIQNYYGLCNILKMTSFPATDRDAFILKFQGNNLPYASDFSVFEM